MSDHDKLTDDMNVWIRDLRRDIYENRRLLDVQLDRKVDKLIDVLTDHFNRMHDALRELHS